MRPLSRAHPRRWSEALGAGLRCPRDGSRHDAPGRRSQEEGPGGQGPRQEGEDAGRGVEACGAENAGTEGHRFQGRHVQVDGQEGSGQEDDGPQDCNGRRGNGGFPPPGAGEPTKGQWPCARRRRRRRRPVRLFVCLLAGRCGLGRRRRGEEDLPAREDLRRRSDAARGPATGRHGARGRAGGIPPLHGAAGLRFRPIHRDAVARAPALPRLRLHDHPP